MSLIRVLNTHRLPRTRSCINRGPVGGIEKTMDRMQRVTLSETHRGDTCVGRPGTALPELCFGLCAALFIAALHLWGLSLQLDGAGTELWSRRVKSEEGARMSLKMSLDNEYTSRSGAFQREEATPLARPGRASTMERTRPARGS